MFSNVVSTQDLLSDSQRSSYSNDSALFSLSQRQLSQDMFTQKLTGSQSENSYAGSRKISMYDKWMSKGSLFKRDPPRESHIAGATSQFPRSNSSSSLQAARKEKDDRELLQQVVTIIQDCNKEVKSTLGVIKDKLDSQTEMSPDKMTEMLKAFLENIWKHEDRMLHAVEDRNCNTSKISELEKQLAAKDAEIQQLHQQLKGQENQDVKLVAKAVRQEMSSPQLAMENKLQEILEVTRETSEQQCRQLDQYKHQMTLCSKQHSEWNAAYNKLIKDMEKRLQKEIGTLKCSLQQQEEDWQHKLHDELLDSHRVHCQDIEHLLDQLLSHSTSRAAGSNRQGQDTGMQAAINSLKKELQSVVQKQVKTVEQSIKELLGQQLRCQQDQLQALHTSLMADVTACVQQASSDQQKEEDVTPLTLPLFEEKFDEYHKDIKQQLQDLHHRHVQEVLRLQQEMKTKGSDLSAGSSKALEPSVQSQPNLCAMGQMPPTSESCELSRTRCQFSGTGQRTGSYLGATAAFMPFTSTGWKIHAQFPQESSGTTCDGGKTHSRQPFGYRLHAGRGLARISPLSKQEKANLFSKSKPSPVMAVLPLPQAETASSQLTTTATQTNPQSSWARHTVASSEEEAPQDKHIQDQPPAKVGKRDKTQGRKKRGPAQSFGQRREAGKKKMQGQRRSICAQSACRVAPGSPEAQSGRGTASNLDVYDLHSPRARNGRSTSGDKNTSGLLSSRTRTGRDTASSMDVCGQRSPRSRTGRASANSMDSYNFSLAQSPDADQHKLDSGLPGREQICSPSQVSNMSHLSSPAVSITEVVVAHRSRWQARSCVPQQKLQTGQKDVLDILSTPNLESKPSLPVNQQQLCHEKIETKRELRSWTKRKC